MIHHGSDCFAANDLLMCGLPSAHDGEIDSNGRRRPPFVQMYWKSSVPPRDPALAVVVAAAAQLIRR